MASEARYLFARRLALTGLAEILLARRSRPKDPDRLVVIRRLLPHVLEDAAFMDVFLAEVRASERLSHPNIAEIVEVVHTETECSVVMEYVSGESLDGVLGRAEHSLVIPIGIACRIISDAAAGVHSAHVQDPPLIHRDLRPSNLLVTYHGLVKVVDFGIAKANLSNAFTRPGTLRFRYAYAAPEVLKDQPHDARSDVYSLGVVLWELLAGRRLFDGGSPADVIREVLEAEVPVPSLYNRAVPPELNALVLAAIRREPEDRIQSAERMRADLDALLESLHLNVRNTQVGNWLSAVLADQKDERHIVETEVMLAAESTPEPVVLLPRAVSPSVRAPPRARGSSPWLIGLLVAFLLIAAIALFRLVARS